VGVAKSLPPSPASRRRTVRCELQGDGGTLLAFLLSEIPLSDEDGTGSSTPKCRCHYLLLAVTAPGVKATWCCRAAPSSSRETVQGIIGRLGCIYNLQASAVVCG
jgi:hypothetical protein